MSKKFPVLLVKMLYEKGVDDFRQYVMEAQALLQYIDDKQKKAADLFELGVSEEFSMSKDSYIDMLVGQEINTLLANAQPEEVKGPEKIKNPKKSKAKYLYPDEKGGSLTWSGQGKTPAALQRLVDSGKPLETFLIPADKTSQDT